MCFLDKTRCYLVGPMDRAQDGSTWRIDAIKRFQPYGVICFNPYDKPICRGGEDIDDVAHREKMVKEGNWGEVARLMKEVRAIDLRMVDVSDFILAYIDMDAKPYGTVEEIVIANLQKKPIVAVVPGGKPMAPRWLFGQIPHKYILGSFDEAFALLDEVDRGLHADDRWKLFRYQI